MSIAHVDIADLRQDLPAWLERARGGDELVVTDHGAAIARIVPPADPRAEARRELLALRAHAKVGDVESPVGEPWDAADDHP
jgi:antitoxin (DNA-binding transcriptional repressor) of toxin-antitoxin stability system